MAKEYIKYGRFLRSKQLNSLSRSDDPEDIQLDDEFLDEEEY